MLFFLKFLLALISLIIFLPLHSKQALWPIPNIEAIFYGCLSPTIVPIGPLLAAIGRQTHHLQDGGAHSTRIPGSEFSDWIVKWPAAAKQLMCWSRSHMQSQQQFPQPLQQQLRADWFWRVGSGSLDGPAGSTWTWSSNLSALGDVLYHPGSQCLQLGQQWIRASNCVE